MNALPDNFVRSWNLPSTLAAETSSLATKMAIINHLDRMFCFWLLSMPDRNVSFSGWSMTQYGYMEENILIGGICEAWEANSGSEIDWALIDAETAGYRQWIHRAEFGVSIHRPWLDTIAFRSLSKFSADMVQCFLIYAQAFPKSSSNPWEPTVALLSSGVVGLMTDNRSTISRLRARLQQNDDLTTHPLFYATGASRNVLIQIDEKVNAHHLMMAQIFKLVWEHPDTYTFSTLRWVTSASGIRTKIDLLTKAINALRDFGIIEASQNRYSITSRALVAMNKL